MGFQITFLHSLHGLQLLPCAGQGYLGARDALFPCPSALEVATSGVPASLQPGSTEGTEEQLTAGDWANPTKEFL